jgi:hypothetical protein
MTGLLSAGVAVSFMERSERVTDEVIDQLATAFEDMDSQQFLVAYPAPLHLMAKLSEVLPNKQTVATIAEEVHEYFRRMLLGTTTPASPEPMHIVLEEKTPLGEMEPGELLDMLVGKKGNTRKVLATFVVHPEVAPAIVKAEGRIIVPSADGGVNVEATLAYIAKLLLPFNKAERQVDGKFPITADKAFGVTRLVTINLITREINYVGEADGYGVVISALPDERYYPFFWALTTGHPRMPITDDEDEIETYLEQIFAPEDQLKRRWKVILEDFAEAQRRGDFSTRGLFREMTEEQALEMIKQVSGRVDIGGSITEVAPATPDYEQLVREYVDSKLSLLPSENLRITGNHHIMSDTGICRRIVVGGNHNIVRNQLMLDGGIVTGNHNQVVVIAPPRVGVDNQGSHNVVRITNMTWENIFGYLGLVR